MSDDREIVESPEEVVDAKPEKRMETFDDLAQRGSDRPGTFDDIGRRGDSTKVPETFDEIAQGRETKPAGDKPGDKRSPGPEALDSSDNKKLDDAAQRISRSESLKPENWRTLSPDDKRKALETSGKAMGDAYHTPDPPLATEKADPDKLGDYGDGYSYDRETDKIVGHDYGVRMNEYGIDERNRRLFGDDPRAALETYSHEFRHSYQAEQAHAHEKGFRTDDPIKAKEWAENFRDYHKPPNPRLAETDPERYSREYAAYESQPVEVDARGFSEKITARVYPESHGVKD